MIFSPDWRDWPDGRNPGSSYVSLCEPKTERLDLDETAIFQDFCSTCQPLRQLCRLTYGLLRSAAPKSPPTLGRHPPRRAADPSARCRRQVRPVDLSKQRHRPFLVVHSLALRQAAQIAEEPTVPAGARRAKRAAFRSAHIDAGYGERGGSRGGKEDEQGPVTRICQDSDRWSEHRRPRRRHSLGERRPTQVPFR